MGTTPSTGFVAGPALGLGRGRQCLQQTSSRHARVRTPVARVRRGPKPDPVIPASLHLAPPIWDIDHNEFDMAQLKDKVVLIVNVASEDVYTDSSYRTLVSLHEQFHDSGFEILAFPNNWYGQKEPGTNEDIKNLVRETYGAKFPIMNKTDLEESPAFALGILKFPGEIIWNFQTKLLFGRDGLPIARWDLLTTSEYMHDEVRKAVSGL